MKPGLRFFKTFFEYTRNTSWQALGPPEYKQEIETEDIEFGPLAH